MNTNFNLTAKRNSTQKMRLFFLTLASAIVLSSCLKNNSSDNPPPPPPPPPGVGAVGGPVNCANYSPQGLGTLPTRPGVYGQGGYYGDDANSAICAIQLRYVRAELICEMNVRNSSGLLKNTRPLMIYRWNLLTEGMTFPRQFSLVGYIQSFQNGYPIKNSAHFIGNVQGISMTDRNGLLNWTGLETARVIPAAPLIKATNTLEIIIQDLRDILFTQGIQQILDLKIIMTMTAEMNQMVAILAANISEIETNKT